MSLASYIRLYTKPFNYTLPHIVYLCIVYQLLLSSSCLVPAYIVKGDISDFPKYLEGAWLLDITYSSANPSSIVVKVKKTGKNIGEAAFITEGETETYPLSFKIVGETQILIVHNLRRSNNPREKDGAMIIEYNPDSEKIKGFHICFVRTGEKSNEESGVCITRAEKNNLSEEQLLKLVNLRLERGEFERDLYYEFTRL
ncbi:MAG: hypothetical protein KDE33_25305 [Bacteroidetes bacterium]|nr:hypothetical protein [Bacteroidota bacterium]